MSCCQRITRTLYQCMEYYLFGIDRNKINKINEIALKALEENPNSSEDIFRKWVADVYKVYGINLEFEALTICDQYALEQADAKLDPIIKGYLESAFHSFKTANTILAKAQARPVREIVFASTME